MGKKVIKVIMCEQCGALVGDSNLHGTAQHAAFGGFTTFEIEIPVTKRKKRDGNRNKA